MNIFCGFGAHHTVEYAREELEKYLLLIDENNALNIDVGVYSDFDMSTDLFNVLDDEICISIKNNEGIIAGCNERSVLIAVYRFLTELGCVFLRPGKDGEYVPNKSLDNISLEIKERPSYRHRGICIEGANSNENILDIIEWMPKVGMNAYYIQFREAYTFYEQWYSHTNNPLIEGEKITLDDARVFCRNAIEAMKKRSLVFHGVGHGWTCEPLGVNGIGWYDHEEPTPDQEKYIAMVNGKRAWWGKKPLNTNLCYSNPEVRELIIGDIVNYIKSHRDVDVLHFWLGDGANNNCECDNCKDTRPSDYYVMMLNELDKRLESEVLDTKIVFLIYVDLLWAPELQRISNKDRFILMFAPITRSYSQSYEIPQSLPEIKPYVRNKLQMPKSVGDNVAMLKSWQDQFDGDSFDYDYHLLWDHYNDPGYWKLAHILGEDVKNLYKLGLNGLVSCQVQRVFYPTGLPMQIMARALWNKECDLDFEIERFMKASFGEEYKVAEKFLKAMSDLCEPEYVRRDKKTDEGVIENLSKAGEFALSVKSDIIRCMDSCPNRAQRLSWEMLYHHTEYCKRFAELYCEKAKGSSKDVINEKKEALLDYANSFELNERLQPYFDTFVLDVVLKRNTANAELFG